MSDMSDQPNRKFTRRSFIHRGAAGLAFGAVAAQGGLHAGADESANTSKTGIDDATTAGPANRENGLTSGEVYREPAKAVSIIDHSDVVVCGGGPAGISAALTTARAGASVRLIEVNGCLGGIWTAGLLGCILDWSNKLKGKGGDSPNVMFRVPDKDASAFFQPKLTEEILSILDERGARRFNRLYDPEAMKLLLEELCIKAGIKLQLHTGCTAVHREDGRIKLVVTESKSGRQAFAGKVFIDATGDGDLGAISGCKFDYGRAEDGEFQPMSFIVLLSGVRFDEIKPYVSGIPGEVWGEPKSRLAELIKETTGYGPSYASSTLFSLYDDLFCLMANHEYGFKGTDAAELTEASLRGRAEVHRMIGGLRSLGGPWKDIKICASPERIGVRASRRIHGRYMLSDDDISSGARFEDGICRSTFSVDVHSTNPDKSKGIDNRGVHSKPYDIPYRSIVAADVDNLLLAGRCISGSFNAHASYRVTGNAVTLGEAAGMAAYLASANNVLPCNLVCEKTDS